MSVKATKWLTENLSRVKGQNGMRVMHLLADMADDDGRAWPSVATILDKCGLPRQRFHEAQKRLIEDGLLAIEEGVFCLKMSDSAVTENVTYVTENVTPPCHGNRDTDVTENVTACHGNRAPHIREPSRTIIEPLSALQNPETPPPPDPTTILNCYPKQMKIPSSLQAIQTSIDLGADPCIMLERTKLIAAAIREEGISCSNGYLSGSEKFFQDERWREDPEVFLSPFKPHQEPVEKMRTSL